MIERFELMAKIRKELENDTLLQERKQPLFDLVYQIMTPADWAYSLLRMKIDNEK